MLIQVPWNVILALSRVLAYEMGFESLRSGIKSFMYNEKIEIVK